MTDLLEEMGETGDERVEAALGGLARLGALPVSAHADVFEEVFTGLEQALAAVNDVSGRELAAVGDIPGRVVTPAHGVPGRGPILAAAVSGVDTLAGVDGLAGAEGLSGQGPAPAHGVSGQGTAPADGTPDRRP
ncbi:hypothetical protein [Streptosporangium sp. H16]|uniref:hypothetical protein n=1 Tax=Streptosporangium sp. H16 TaxID=3444184 RepID=UPI003F79A8FE